MCHHWQRERSEWEEKDALQQEEEVATRGEMGWWWDATESEQIPTYS